MEKDAIGTMAKGLEEHCSGGDKLKAAVKAWTDWHLENTTGVRLSKGLAVAKIVTEYAQLDD